MQTFGISYHLYSLEAYNLYLLTIVTIAQYSKLDIKSTTINNVPKFVIQIELEYLTIFTYNNYIQTFGVRMYLQQLNIINILKIND